MKSQLLAFVGILLLLAGCASTPTHHLTQSERARYNNIPSETVINDVKAKMVQARTDRLDYYAPENFSNAQQATKALTKLSPNTSNRDEILEYAATAQDALATGYTAKQTALKTFAEVLALNVRLKKLGAPTLQPAQYSLLSRRLRSLMGVLDKGDTAKANKEKAALKGDMEALKIQIIKQSALGEARKLVNTLRTGNAIALAPKSVRNAENDLDRADAYIQMHSDDSNGVAKAAEAALIAARHAQWMTARIKQLSVLQTPPFEEMLLTEERRLNSIGGILGIKDIQGETLEKQTTTIAAAAAHTTAALATASEQDAKLTQQVHDCQTSAGTQSSHTSALQVDNDLLTQKVSMLQANIGVLKNQLQLLQNILFTKTGHKIPMTGTGINTTAANSANSAVNQTPSQAKGAMAQAKPQHDHKEGTANTTQPAPSATAITTDGATGARSGIKAKSATTTPKTANKIPSSSGTATPMPPKATTAPAKGSDTQSVTNHKHSPTQANASATAPIAATHDMTPATRHKEPSVSATNATPSAKGAAPAEEKPVTAKTNKDGKAPLTDSDDTHQKGSTDTNK